MVNLVITGKAVSNTFDNTMEIDTGGAKKVFKISYNHSVLILADVSKTDLVTLLF